VFFDTEAHEVLISHLKLRRLERFMRNGPSCATTTPTASSGAPSTKGSQPWLGHLRIGGPHESHGSDSH
jgi:hypothetical protein